MVRVTATSIILTALLFPLFVGIYYTAHDTGAAYIIGSSVLTLNLHYLQKLAKKSHSF